MGLLFGWASGGKASAYINVCEFSRLFVRLHSENEKENLVTGLPFFKIIMQDFEKYI